jgi:DNA-binding NarL/FixJ family response regulator
MPPSVARSVRQILSRAPRSLDFCGGGDPQTKPLLVFLDDILKPSTNALQTMPLLRQAGYSGPIIVISGQVTHSRRSDLIAGGASDVIHKDDVDSVRVAEAIAGLDLKPENNAP